MSSAEQLNEDQESLWNGRAGQAWVEAQSLLDGLFRLFEALLTDESLFGEGSAVLDVGCGTGATTLAAARKVGEGGEAVGIDLSKPMIAAARARAEKENAPARFIHDNAQSHAFPDACFDAIISRFGVMFFDAPVTAFANLRRAAKPGARLRFIAWRSPAENPFMTTAESAAGPLLPNLPPRRPTAQGQFGFADRCRIETILQESGWSRFDIQPIDVTCMMPEAELSRYFTNLGPLGRILPQTEEPLRDKIIETVRSAYEPFIAHGEVRFTAFCWMADAQVAL